MPTGYTADIQDGKVTDVRDYAAQAARAFGAFIHQRDDGRRATLTYPEKPTEGYYQEALARAEADERWWNESSEEEKYAKWSDYVAEKEAHLRAALARDAQTRARYEAMLAQVYAVDVPEPLVNFKNFLVSQLQDSIKADCHGEEWIRKYNSPLSYSEWYDHEAKGGFCDADYYREKIADEWDRYNERVEYINLMRDTFGFEVEE